MFTAFQNKRSPNIGGGYANIGGGYANKTRGHSNKTRENKEKQALFLHEPTRFNTKSRVEHLFYPSKRPVLATSTGFTLTQPIYPPTRRWFCASGLGESGVDASGLWPFGPNSSVGIGVRFLGDFPRNEKQSLVIVAPMVYYFPGQKNQ
jgi:hypothetical protein